MLWFITKFALIALVALTSTYGAGVMIDKAIPKPTPIQYPFYDPTPFPSPTSGPTPTKKPIISPSSPQVKGVQTTRKILVNCIGPDGLLMTDKTQEECDNFNTAWNRKPTNAPTYTSNSNKPSTPCPVAITIDCGIQSRPGYKGIGCTLEEAQKSCISASSHFGSYESCRSEKNAAYEACKSPCNNQHDQEKGICAYAYTGSSPGIELNPTKYGECLDESSVVWSNCTTACQNTYFAALDTCSSQ